FMFFVKRAYFPLLLFSKRKSVDPSRDRVPANFLSLNNARPSTSIAVPLWPVFNKGRTMSSPGSSISEQLVFSMILFKC
ncbi:hypothetical protein U5A85_08930, partial [Priestia megaterium]